MYIELAEVNNSLMRLVGWIVLIAASLLVIRLAFHAAVRSALRVRSAQPNLRERTLLRFEPLGFNAWMFAILKTRLDSMFTELPELLDDGRTINNFLDLGCGFGIAGSFLLELFPQSKAVGIDPSAARVAGASIAFQDRGFALRGAAPDFESAGLPALFDAVFFIDVIHFLSDEESILTLTRIARRLNSGGQLIIRANIIPAGRGSLLWNVYALYRLITQAAGHFRTVNGTRSLIVQAGFDVVEARTSSTNPELHWFVCTPSSIR